MNIDSFDAAFYLITFIVPGFICSAVVSMLVPGRAQALEMRTLEFLTLSCVNYGIWSWAIYLLAKARFLEHSPLTAAFLLGAIVFVSPVVLGLVIAKSSQKRWAARFLRRFGFRTIHPIPTAWDYLFSR